MSELTALAAVLDVVVIALPAADPALLTALAAVGLEPDRCDATELATPPTVEPTLWPVLDTTWETLPPAFEMVPGTTAGMDGTSVDVPPALPCPFAGVDPLEFAPPPPGPFREEFTPPPLPAARVPPPVAVRPVPAVPAASAVGLACPAAAISTRWARDGVARLARETDTATGGGWLPTWGQPRNATIALASRNISAAPASNDPDVPNPARYARVARTFSTYRPSAGKPLSLSDRWSGRSEPWPALRRWRFEALRKPFIFSA